MGTAGRPRMAASTAVPALRPTSSPSRRMVVSGGSKQSAMGSLWANTPVARSPPARACSISRPPSAKPSCRSRKDCALPGEEMADGPLQRRGVVPRLGHQRHVVGLLEAGLEPAQDRRDAGVAQVGHDHARDAVATCTLAAAATSRNVTDRRTLLPPGVSNSTSPRRPVRGRVSP